MATVAQSQQVAGAAPPARAPVQVVPVRGLPVVAAVLTGLVAAIAVNAAWALDFYHVVGGALWTSLDLVLGFVIGPILRRLSVPARAEFTSRFMPMMVLIMPTLVAMTLASGFQLALTYGYLLPASPNRLWLITSFAVVGVMATIALAILSPANITVLLEMRKPRPNGELIARLMRRFLYTAGITGAMQVATLIIMTRVATQ